MPDSGAWPGTAAIPRSRVCSGLPHHPAINPGAVTSTTTIAYTQFKLRPLYAGNNIYSYGFFSLEATDANGPVTQFSQPYTTCVVLSRAFPDVNNHHTTTTAG